MSMNLIGDDILIMRTRYDEALEMQGIACRYQFPLMPNTNAQAESVVDSYSDMVNTHIFFDGTPTVKTYKRLGWVVENDKNLPFLIHCSFNLKSLQRDCLFHISGQYTGLGDRIFRVVELTTAMQVPDHIVAQVVPVYDKNVVGRTPVEERKKFNKSNTFLKGNTDYRGNYLDDKGADLK